MVKVYMCMHVGSNMTTFSISHNDRNNYQSIYKPNGMRDECREKETERKEDRMERGNGEDSREHNSISLFLLSSSFPFSPLSSFSLSLSLSLSLYILLSQRERTAVERVKGRVGRVRHTEGVRRTHLSGVVVHDEPVAREPGLELI